MARVAALLVLGTLTASGTLAADDGAATAVEGIRWTKDWEAAKAQAAKENKGLLVYLTPDWFQ
jgi:hypothetical protein